MPRNVEGKPLQEVGTPTGKTGRSPSTLDAVEFILYDGPMSPSYKLVPLVPCIMTIVTSIVLVVVAVVVTSTTIAIMLSIVLTYYYQDYNCDYVLLLFYYCIILATCGDFDLLRWGIN